eukprot:416702-Pyramimonas_sp.AAC.1
MSCLKATKDLPPNTKVEQSQDPVGLPQPLPATPESPGRKDNARNPNAKGQILRPPFTTARRHDCNVCAVVSHLQALAIS